MELIGLICAMPVALVVSIIYTNYVLRTYEKRGFLYKIQRVLPYFIFPLLIVEILLLQNPGPLAAHNKYGAWFDLMHFINLLFGSAAVVNWVVSMGKISERDNQYLVTRFFAYGLCFIVLMASAFTNIVVDEAICGINGECRESK